MLQKELLERQFKQATLRSQRRLRKLDDTWWSELAAEMKVAARQRNSKQLQHLRKRAFCPITASPLLMSKDGTELLTSLVEIGKKCKEH